MNHIYWLSQITATEHSFVGDKVFILSQLLQQEFPIVPGFVLGSMALKEFLAILVDSESPKADLLDASLNIDVNDYRALQSLAQKSRQAIFAATFPPQWQERILAAAGRLHSQTLILRPSLIVPAHLRLANFGLWRSHICTSESEALAQGIKQVWADIFSARSLFYWQKLGITTDKLNLAILIQPFKNAIASGTIEIKPELIRIRATWGLNQSLLWGETQPDFYEVQRQEGTILKQQIGNKIYGYRLVPPTKSKQPQTRDGLEIYAVNEQQQKQQVLDASLLEQLIKLTQEIVAKQPLVKYLEWTLPEITASDPSNRQFFITQLNYYLPLASASEPNSQAQSANQPLLKGLAASPGIITAPVVVLAQTDSELAKVTAGKIVVTDNITPGQIPLLSQAVGIISEQGGITNHAAIVARERKIPAVVGAAQATKLLQTGELILLNGDTGEIHRSGAEKEEKEAKKEVVSQESQHPLNISSFSFDYPIATQLMVNISQPNAIANAASLPIDGIGLLRSELLLLDLLSAAAQPFLPNKSNSELLEQLILRLRQFVAAFAPRPVFYRSLDWRSHELTARNRQKSVNPMVGIRGTYSYLLDSAFFDLELEALARLQAEGYSNLNLILPFVRSVQEFRFCRRRLKNYDLIDSASLQVWIMAEVPSVIYLLPEYVQAGVQGIAIGTNDLAQLLLGVDREQAHFTQRGLHANHPAMLKAIAQLIQTARASGIPCSICGQAPVQYPTMIDQLVRWGITTISVEPEALTATYQAIARAEQRLLLEQVRARQ